MNQPLKILFKFPCRGREASLFESLDSLDRNIRDRENYLISLTLDTDDDDLNRPDVINRLMTFSNVSIEWGLSDSKVHAINRSMPDYDFDVIICWSNDQFATFFGFDDHMRTSILNKFGNDGMDALCHFGEPDSREALNVLYVATRKYYDRFGFIYHPSYKSLWCDNETLEIGKMLGRYHYFGIEGLYEHRNPAYNKYNVARDFLFDMQQAWWPVDEANFHKRKAHNFDIHLYED